MEKSEPEDNPSSETAQILETKVIQRFYDDALHRPLVAAGNAAGAFIEGAHLVVGRAIEAVAHAPAKLRLLVDRVSKRVPPDRQIAAEAGIAGPILEGIRYEDVDSPAWRMYQELLSNACDKERRRFASRTFPNIIRHLARDEAIILQWAYTNHSVLMCIASEAPDFVRLTHREDQGRVVAGAELDEPTEQLTVDRAMLDQEDLTADYYNHLYQLGLVTNTPFVPLLREKHVDRTSNEARPAHHPPAGVIRVHLTSFGRRFCDVCLPSEGYVVDPWLPKR
jgi:abortive infection alpha-like protein